jgi:serine/threonine protein kinase/WD40 repeat protein
VDPNRRQQIEQLYNDALQREEGDRLAFVQQACEGNQSLQREIEALLAGRKQSDRLLETTAIPVKGLALWEGRVPSEITQAIHFAPISGRSISHYELLEKLGEGGMGEVFKAHDKRLNRIVALKFLGVGRVADPEQETKLVQEARTASTFHHPNIAHIYDIDQAELTDHDMEERPDVPRAVTNFIVMEYISGPTLAQILSAQRLDLNTILVFATQIADALAAAHREGVLHRDLKPGNVIVDKNGTVKVLDFGLAKVIDQAPNTYGLIQFPGSAFADGVILGTPAYMSPEQAEGKNLGVQSDIFSFGAVLYEMVSGLRAFSGESDRSAISAVVRHEPQPLKRLVSDLPSDLEKIVSRCLRKDPAARFQSMTAVRQALVKLKEDLASVKPGVLPAPRKRLAKWRLAVGCVLAMSIGAIVWFSLSSHGYQLDPHVTPLTSYAGFQGYPAFSPDGAQVAFAWTGLSGTVTHIYVKIIGLDKPLQLTFGNLSDAHPAWSPDGKSIAFLRSLSPTIIGIFEIAPLGGTERHITDIRAGLFQALGWSHDGKWLVTSSVQASETPSRIFVISAGNGDQRPLSLQDTRDEFYPALSPDSRFLAFCRMLSDGDWGIFVVPLNKDLQPKGIPKRLRTPLGLNRQPVWTPDGADIIFVNGNVSTAGLWRVSAHGENPARELRMSTEVAYQPAIAPKGDRLAYAHDFNNVNIWSMSVRGSGKVSAATPIIVSGRSSWVKANALSPDGKKIAFESDRSGPYGIWIANNDGSDARLLFGSTANISGSPAWSPDGHQIAFDSHRDKVGIFVISADGGAARPLANPQKDNMVPAWSHDGKWIYFSSNRTGSFEVFKISPQGGDEIQVTNHGGWGPQESPDGKFLFYSRTRAASTSLLKVSVNGGQEIQILSSVHERWWAVDTKGIWFMKSAVTELEPGNWKSIWLSEGATTERGNIYFLNFANGSVSIASSIPKSPTGGLAISIYGGTLVFNQVDHRATELLLVENFR